MTDEKIKTTLKYWMDKLEPKSFFGKLKDQLLLYPVILGLWHGLTKTNQTNCRRKYQRIPELHR